jgi:hypothetical protein
MPSQISVLIGKASQGDADSINQLAMHFWEVARRAADKRLSQQMKRRVGASDIANAGLRSALSHLTHGDSTIRSRTDLEGCVRAFVIAKAKTAGRKERAKKRDVRRDTSLDACPIVSEKAAARVKEELGECARRVNDLICQHYEGRKQKAILLGIIYDFTPREIVELLDKEPLADGERNWKVSSITTFLRSAREWLKEAVFVENEDGQTK